MGYTVWCFTFCLQHKDVSDSIINDTISEYSIKNIKQRSSCREIKESKLLILSLNCLYAVFAYILSVVL